MSKGKQPRLLAKAPKNNLSGKGGRITETIRRCA